MGAQPMEPYWASGFLVDLYLASPLGLSALTYALIGYLLGIISELIAEDVERIVIP